MKDEKAGSLGMRKDTPVAKSCVQICSGREKTANSAWPRKGRTESEAASRTRKNCSRGPSEAPRHKTAAHQGTRHDRGHGWQVQKDRGQHQRHTDAQSVDEP